MAKYYPKLSGLFLVDDLPEELAFLTELSTQLLDGIYFRGLHVSVNGDSASVSRSLELILYKRIGVEIPGVNIEFSLNPDYESGMTGTGIPIVVNTEWPIKSYLSNMGLKNFSGDMSGFYNLGQEMLQADKGAIIGNACATFLTEGDNPLEQFAIDVNNGGYVSTNIPLPLDPDGDVAVQDIIDHIDQYAQSTIEEIVYDMYIKDQDEDVENQNLQQFYELSFGSNFASKILDLFIPKISARAELNAGILFPRKMLIPIDGNGDIVTDPDERFQIKLDLGDFFFSSNGQFGFKEELVANPLPYPKAQIGNTGFTFAFTNVWVDLSTKKNLAQVSAAGYPNDFRGVFVESVAIGLPPFLTKDGSSTAELFGTNLIIGTGGFSGTIGLDTTNGSVFKVTVGGFTVSLDAFDITFRQNEIINSDIHGTLTIPGFKDGAGDDAEINVTVNIGTDGDFKLCASEPQGIPIEIPDVLKIHIYSLQIVKEGEDWYLAISGEIEFTLLNTALEGFLPDRLQAEVRIYDDGRFEFHPSTLPLGRSVNLKIGPSTTINARGIHLGSFEQTHNGQLRKYKYIGFDGEISAGPIGLDAQGTGVKCYFTVDGGTFHTFLRIEGINIDLVVPADRSKETVLMLKGFLSIKGPSPEFPERGDEYIGGVSFSLPKAGFSGSAAMRLIPKLRAFIVDASLELPSPIVLGASGFGIYGFRGLFGQRFVASRSAEALQGAIEPDAKWWEYYKAKVAPDYREGVQVSKFRQQDGFSVGAGASLATALDSGKMFSSKVFLLLALPEVFLIQGQGAILSKRVGLDTIDDPPFFVMLTISSSSIEAAFGVNITLPKNFSLTAVKIDALLEMGFFFKNASGWYINLGTEERPVQAELITIFQGYAYLMLSSDGFRLGAGIDFSLDEKIGPLHIDLKAFIDAGLFINRKHFQAGGFLQLGANLMVSVWKVGIGLSASASLAGEAPKPLIVTGSVEACIKVIKKWCFEIDFTWQKEKALNLDPLEIIEADKTEPLKGININTREAFSLNRVNGSSSAIPAPSDASWANTFEDVVLPLDTFIDIELQKPVGPNQSSASMQAIGGYTQGAKNVEYLAPKKAYSKQVEHQYKINNIQIKYWDEVSGSWEDYDPYMAMLHLADLDFVEPGDLENKKKGHWQLQSPNRFNRVRLLSQSPLSFLNDSNHPDTEFENFGFNGGTILCEDEQINKTCINWVEKELNTVYKSGISYGIDDVLFKVYGYNGRVESVSNPFDIEPSLVVRGETSIEFYFPEPTAEIDLKLSTSFGSVVITFYQKAYEEDPPYTGRTGLPAMHYDQVDSMIVGADQLVDVVSFSSPDSPIDKIIITGLGCEGQGGEDPPGDGGDEYEPLFYPDYSDYQCWLAVHELCYLARESYLFNISIPSQSSIQNQNQSDVDGFNKVIQPIWRPNTKFAVQVEVDDVVNGTSNIDYYTYGFQTKGPLGHFHQNDPRYVALEETDQEDQYKLSKLKNYVDYKRSYPNADGSLAGAKPLYYSNNDNEVKLRLHFVKPYVYSFFYDWSEYGSLGEVYSKLETVIKDPADPVQQAQNKLPAWEKNMALKPAQDARTLNNLIEYGENCVGQIGPVTPYNLNAKVELEDLKPSKLYTAIFNAVYKESATAPEAASQVHQYPFRTSRYANFAEHILSYRLDDGAGVYTIFDVALDSSADLTLAGHIVTDQISPQPDNLLSKFAMRYDRLMQGAFLMTGVNALPAPQTTEFNKVIDGSGTVVGLWVRSPEPINDPKLPEAERAVTTEVAHSVGGQSFSNLFSRDMTGIFITNDQMDIPSGQMTIDFHYRLFNGSEYENLKTVQVALDV